MPISNAEEPQICLLPHKTGPSKVFKAQFSNLAEPSKMRWLGHRGTSRVTCFRAACARPKWQWCGARCLPKRQARCTDVLAPVWWQHEASLFGNKFSSLLAAQRLLWNSPWCSQKKFHWNQWPSVRTLNKIRLSWDSPVDVLGSSVSQK